MKKDLILPVITALCIILALLPYQQNQQKDQFTAWKQMFKFNWTPVQDAYRKTIFMNNLKKFALHNADPTNTYKMGITQFTAMTQAEFQMTYLSPKPYNPEWQNSDLNVPEVTSDIDWTQKGIVSPVKFMGNCGAGWAFSAVASLQSLALTKNQTLILSEQQLIDCTIAYGNFACDDGDNYQALNYVKDHGITTENAYPYVQKMQKCKIQGGSFKISGWHYAKGCPALLSAIQQRPLGVSVDATNWPHYRSGIFNQCDQTLRINLDVFLVGATSTYWKIKNAWGTTWGENGYIRLKHTNTCGMCVDKSPWAY